MFDYGEESDGTRRLIELLDVIQNDNKGKTFLIDELDRSFHPQMTKKFIETFFKATKDNDTQLLITTHESNLLDLQLLRQDEIWFVERDKDYASRLYSLDNFKVRYDKKIDKNYLEGRYGAVPLFKNFDLLLGDENENC
jgi:AAA15 family ATPase/GTPase